MCSYLFQASQDILSKSKISFDDILGLIFPEIYLKWCKTKSDKSGLETAGLERYFLCLEVDVIPLQVYFNISNKFVNVWTWILLGPSLEGCLLEGPS